MGVLAISLILTLISHSQHYPLARVERTLDLALGAHHKAFHFIQLTAGIGSLLAHFFTQGFHFRIHTACFISSFFQCFHLFHCNVTMQFHPIYIRFQTLVYKMIKRGYYPSSKSLFKPQTPINKSFIFQRKKEQIVRKMEGRHLVFICELCKRKKKIRT